MWLRRAALIASIAFIAAGDAFAQSVSKDAAKAPAGTYQLEASHSQVLFSVLHEGFTDYYGRFDRVSGTLNFDPAQLERCTVSITIDTSSVDTPSRELINELKGPNVFDTNRFGTATFKSTSVVRTGANTGRITGDLTIKGVTRPVTLDVVFIGSGDDPLKGSYAIGFRASATIKRSDFGLTGMSWESFVSDEVRLIIGVMFER